MSVTKFAAWLSTPNVPAIEIVAQAGYDTVLLDAEHGTFGLSDLNSVVPLASALGLTVLVKAAAPERAPIQQALDFGAHGVVIPHVLGVEHAREVCAFAKVPPLGDRSLAGGRTMNYAGFDDRWARGQNENTLCLPMIEDIQALDEIEKIVDLDTVDGIFVGPGDLFIRRGTGGFQRTSDDFDDMARIAQAARTAGKPWMLPAWTPEEQGFGITAGADTVVLLQEFTALRSGFVNALATAQIHLTPQANDDNR